MEEKIKIKLISDDILVNITYHRVLYLLALNWEEQNVKFINNEVCNSCMVKELTKLQLKIKRKKYSKLAEELSKLQTQSAMIRDKIQKKEKEVYKIFQEIQFYK